MSEKVLTQKEIDELFARYEEQPIKQEAKDLLNMQELDIIGEIGNICMGTAATTLSQLLSQRVIIGYPKIIVCQQDEVFGSFSTPYLIIEVQFKEGLNGFNVLVINEEEIAIIADIMMGGNGQVTKPVMITEMELSASTEAMNQMIGSSATAMADLFGIGIDIAPPKATMVEDLLNASHTPLPTDKPVVVARFEITIGDIIKTTFMQITNVDAARDQANYLLMKAGACDAENTEEKASDETVIQNFTQTKAPFDLPNLAGALAIPVDLEFSLGKIRCTAGDLAKLKKGDTLAIPFSSQQIKLLVGGIPVALGELQTHAEETKIKISRLYQKSIK
ncbi:CheC, inhibitor of MCP methylation [Desulforamulus reducens MI-1]|uniref:CheC, inhibitor of MCP methylation n=1 Tax=Desulforamulus reducens (strain ATCC BAA-1160 / DSM 100696 / MI-1) TaxID=349161 RepID=A4J3G9_DESRM|nr:flagellar motor switch phosphatase FliY [Desulforamulus reducens]ABO49622.1 CheC, inhibitor of MCP methylation [Desulforamulus reducens MI-1]